ncbi:restriction endonuclease subunit S [Streptomyces sp. NPDC056628]|uniref:restriction endonuclease subunit S n=1 Tax=Streptomyces sp. NPDC056628 TaxID=3345882 RepID=UPI00368C912A
MSCSTDQRNWRSRCVSSWGGSVLDSPIPLHSGWELRTLGELVTKIGSGATPRGGKEVYVERGTPFIRSQNVVDHRMLSDDIAYIGDEAARALSGVTVRRGDVLLNITGDSIARCALVDPVLESARVNQHVAIIRTSNLLDPVFLQKYLVNPAFKRFMISHSSGATRKALTKRQIEQFPILVPPRSEQEAIAAVLGALDEKIAVNERVATTSDALASARHRWTAITSAGKFERLGRLAQVVVGGTPSRAKPEYWTGGTVHWINSGKANDFRVIQPSEMITEEGLANSSVKLMPPGATLIGITGATMGQISRLEITAGGSQNVAGVWSDDQALNDWLFYDIRFRVADLTKHASGGAQQHINKRVITELECRVPFSDDLREWSAGTAPLVKLSAQVLLENRALATLRDALLPQLMSGRLRVKDAEKIVEDAT